MLCISMISRTDCKLISSRSFSISIISSIAFWECACAAWTIVNTGRHILCTKFLHSWKCIFLVVGCSQLTLLHNFNCNATFKKRDFIWKKKCQLPASIIEPIVRKDAFQINNARLIQKPSRQGGNVKVWIDIHEALASKYLAG